MTQVLIELRTPTQPGVDTGASGWVECTPLRRRHIDGYVRIPGSFTAPLVDGAALVVLRATLPDECWQITEATRRQFTRHVAVPESGDVVSYAALVDVDPTTLTPSASSVPAWDAAVDTVVAIRDETVVLHDATAAIAGGVAEVAVVMEGHASAAALSASNASDSASGAASDRDVAQTARTGAGSARDAAAGHAATASIAVGVVTAARDETVTARDQAVPAAATAVTARNEAVAARDATVAASTIVGAGRPDIPATMTAPVQALVTAAASGAVFRSTDGPQGAWEWRKKGTAWTVTDGNTGACNMPLSPEGQVRYPNMVVTGVRTTNGVSFVIRESIPSAAGIGLITLFSVLRGWAMDVPAATQTVDQTVNLLNATFYNDTASRTGYYLNRTHATAARHQGQLSGPCSAPWPATI